MTYDGITTATIAAAFTEAVESLSGRIADTFDDGTRLFMRSLLPYVEEVRPSDRLQGGLALRASESEIWLHPYLFREVCRNGAIMAHAIGSWHHEHTPSEPEDAVMAALQGAILECSAKRVFAEAVGGIRSSAAQADSALNLLPFLSRMQGSLPADFLRRIFELFAAEQDRSRFGLMNVVTSVARDTQEPEQRWRLEEMGGGIGAGISPPRPADGGEARREPVQLLNVS